MDDGLFMAMLSEHELLPGDMENKIKSQATQVEKASYFINHVIKPSLDIDSTVYPEQLLVTMKESDYAHVKELANKITTEIAKSDSIVGTSQHR